MNESLSPVTNGQGVSRETRDRLEIFANLFFKWAASMNLVAPSTLGAMRSRHVEDSLQIYRLSPGAHEWMDLGSGGGFPGIITAICLAEIGDGWVHLVESNRKKAAFLRQALVETGARGSVHALRIEAVTNEHVKTCDRISARALADLDTLLGYIEPWAERNGELRAFLHKGRDYRRELDISHRRWDFHLVEHSSLVEEGSVILEISNLRRRNR